MRGLIFLPVALGAYLKGGPEIIPMPKISKMIPVPKMVMPKVHPIIEQPEVKLMMPPKWPVVGWVVNPEWNEHFDVFKNIDFPEIPGAVISKEWRIQPLLAAEGGQVEVGTPFRFPGDQDQLRHYISKYIDVDEEGSLALFKNGGLVLNNGELPKFLDFHSMLGKLHGVGGMWHQKYQHFRDGVHDQIQHVATTVSETIDAKDGY